MSPAKCKIGHFYLKSKLSNILWCSGIGIVNAIEVVHAFPEEDGLKKFKEWIESPDPAILEKLDSHTGGSSRNRSSKASKDNADGMRKNVGLSTIEETVLGSHVDQPSVSGTQDIKDVFMSKHVSLNFVCLLFLSFYFSVINWLSCYVWWWIKLQRNVSKNWHIPPSFPSDSVITAYISPQVDESTEPFSWGKPDLVLLRRWVSALLYCDSQRDFKSFHFNCLGPSYITSCFKY